MKFNLKSGWLTPAALAVLSSASVPTLADECDASTLRGLYIHTASGFNVVNGAAVPKAIVEYLRFDGVAGVTVPTVTLSNNGMILRPPNGAGMYTIEPDCTGRLSFSSGVTYDLIVTPGGGEISMIQTGGAFLAVFEGKAKRVSR